MLIRPDSILALSALNLYSRLERRVAPRAAVQGSCAPSILIPDEDDDVWRETALPVFSKSTSPCFD